MSPASSWALLGLALVALPVCVVMFLAILADLGSPVVACDEPLRCKVPFCDVLHEVDIWSQKTLQNLKA